MAFVHSSGRHNTGDTSWHVLEHDPMTQQTKWVKIEDGLAHIRITQPDELTYQMLEINKREANEWQANGGWGAAKKGAVVARVPTIIDNELKRKAGYDPTVSGWYDKDKYNSFLDDIDYRHFRTGGGKIGRKKAAVFGIKSRLLAGATPLTLVKNATDKDTTSGN